ncbi:MAG: hypothetical protein D6806_08210 [Deltaproteobacteria bacterium]|nr:MAG: hypothetical protein D6806_08210 [Deltaproteobacteria bacterium]
MKMGPFFMILIKPSSCIKRLEGFKIKQYLSVELKLLRMFIEATKSEIRKHAKNVHLFFDQYCSIGLPERW